MIKTHKAVDSFRKKPFPRNCENTNKNTRHTSQIKHT